MDLETEYDLSRLQQFLLLLVVIGFMNDLFNFIFNETI